MVHSVFMLPAWGNCFAQLPVLQRRGSDLMVP